MLVQLKPGEELFYKFVFNEFKRFDAMLLCEGGTEVKVVKAIIGKLGIEIKLALGLTDCEGINMVPQLAGVIALLARISRKLKVLSVLVNAETMDFIDRVESITNSLKSKGLQVSDPQPITRCNQVFQLDIKINSRTLPLIIAVNGIKEFKFAKRCIEDHAVKLMLLEGKIGSQEVLKYGEAKQIVRGNEIIENIRNSNKENIILAFNHITCLLNSLAVKIEADRKRK